MFLTILSARIASGPTGREWALRATFRQAMESVLAGWQDDMPASWQPIAAGVTLGFADCDPTLEHEDWEPVFPARRGCVFPGAPKGAHMFHAFDNIAPADVRCVLLGQDPYPCAAFSTGRAFEAGNVAEWRELNKMFSVSVRCFLQQIVAARCGDEGYAVRFAEWPRVLADIEAGRIAFEPATRLADRWVTQGVLLLNSSLTLSRFQVSIDPHQSRGHLPIWRPLLVAVLKALKARGAPLVCIGFGDAAAETLALAGIAASNTILRPHPARGDDYLALPNPFNACNSKLLAMGAQPIAW
jgi:uracil-DNA glycosylase